MHTRRIVLVVASVSFVLSASVAHAQSAIAGVVKDASGAVLPGVTVEASSEVLIEKLRSVVTDGQGQFKIVDLRPGNYVVTFMLTGFQTVRREAVQLPSDFTATLNTEMKVGALEETITVTTAAPTVDVSSAAHVQVLDRETLDTIPTGRTIQGIGQIVVGVNLSLPDVGGSRAAMQTYMSVHGQSAANNTVMVDGMVVNGLEANGAVQSYFNDAGSQEMSYQTAGIGADVSSGGVRLNMVPREGGNRISGSGAFVRRPGEWQGDNLTPRLQTAGLTAGNSTEYIQDLTAAVGGPIMKDKLWFFGAARDYRTSNRISNTFYDDGSQGDDYNYVRNASVRLTYQASARNKVSAYYERVGKYRAHDMQSNYDPETASNVWTSPNYSTGSVKWTSTVSSKLLLDAGYAFNVEYRNVDYQDGVDQERGSAAWYANATRTQAGVTLGTRKTAAPSAGKEWPSRYSYNVAASYVTGSHHMKFGVNGTGGKFFHATRANADLSQQYSDAALTIPVSVIVRNTPVQSGERLNADVGIFAMDNWTLKRLTINAGVRWEYLTASVSEYSAPAGRFVPARQAPEKTDLPNWTDWAPRFQAVYNVFGNGKTAIKYSLNRYNAAQTTAIAAGFNPLRSSTSSSLAWTDLNRDDIAQGQRTWNPDGTFTNCVYLTPGCEINLATLPANFGLLSDAGTYGGYPRGWNLESGLELQHELFPRVSVTGTWYRGWLKNLTGTYNRAVTPADYSPVQINNAVDGTSFTIYNISAAAQARATDSITILDPDRKNIYNSYSVEFRARPGRGILLFGGVSWERELSTNCTGGKSDPNALRFCDQFNLPEDHQIPIAANLRFNASYPIPKVAVTVSASLQSNDGGAQAMSYTILRTTRYPDGSNAYLAAGVPVPACPSPCAAGALVAPNLTLATLSTPLYPTGSLRYERLNQLDLRVSKTFRIDRMAVTPTLEMFNINNTDKVITVASTSYALAGGAYLRPNSIVQGRIIGVGAQVRF